MELNFTSRLPTIQPTFCLLATIYRSTEDVYKWWAIRLITALRKWFTSGPSIPRAILRMILFRCDREFSACSLVFLSVDLTAFENLGFSIPTSLQ